MPKAFPSNPVPQKKALIHPYDIDLNDGPVRAEIENINPKLGNAIASSGNAIAEVIDRQNSTSSDCQDLANLLLVSPLSTVSGAARGLNLNDIISFLAAPGREISHLKKNVIIGELESEGLPANDQQLNIARELRDNCLQQLLSAVRKSFSTLLYPTRDGLRTADFLMNLQDNEYNSESQVRDALLDPVRQIIGESQLSLRCDRILFSSGQDFSNWIADHKLEIQDHEFTQTAEPAS